MVNFVPAGYRILVKPDAVENTIKLGDTDIDFIITGDKKLEQAGQMRGTLIAAGEQAWVFEDTSSPWAKVGDTVMYARYSGTQLELDGEEYVLMNDKDLLGIIPQR